MHLHHIVIAAVASIDALSDASSTQLCTAITGAHIGKILMQRDDGGRRIMPPSLLKPLAVAP